MDFSIDESPAVEALGSLFKLTEVHLWDDGTSEVRELPYTQESNKLSNGDKEYGKSDYGRFNGFCSLPEDLELVQKMNDLGLPLSFNTNKEKRNGGKKKGTRKSNQQNPIKIDDDMLDSVNVNEDKNNLFNSPKLRDESEILKNATLSAGLERGESSSSSACTSTVSNEHGYNAEVSDIGFDLNLDCSSGISKNVLEEDQCLDGGNSEGSCLINDCPDIDSKEIKDIGFQVIQDSDAAEQNNSNMIDTSQIAVEWMAYWDEFHMRTYFYNVKTEESTWDPPPGMEHVVYGAIADVATDVVNDQMDFSKSDEVSSTVTTKRKKKARRKSNWKLSNSNEDLEGVLEEIPASISKYWCQRYILFSRFDDGIKMDEEGWFSVTPEPLAKHHAARCGNGAIVDFFTGVGGNAIQFARRSTHVIAIDVDPNKIDYARHNAAIYGVDDNIDFMKGDSFSLAPKLKADTVFMSPPWGGPAYSKLKKFDINTMLRPQDGQNLFNAGKAIAPKIVMFLPRNVDVNQLAELSLSANPPWSLEVERNFLNGRLKAVTAYFVATSMS